MSREKHKRCIRLNPHIKATDVTNYVLTRRRPNDTLLLQIAVSEAQRECLQRYSRPISGNCVTPAVVSRLNWWRLLRAYYFGTPACQHDRGTAGTHKDGTRAGMLSARRGDFQPLSHPRTSTFFSIRCSNGSITFSNPLLPNSVFLIEVDTRGSPRSKSWLEKRLQWD